MKEERVGGKSAELEKKEWGIGRQTAEMEELYEKDGINRRKKRKVKEGSVTFLFSSFLSYSKGIRYGTLEGWEKQSSKERKNGWRAKHRD